MNGDRPAEAEASSGAPSRRLQHKQAQHKQAQP